MITILKLFGIFSNLPKYENIMYITCKVYIKTKVLIL